MTMVIGVTEVETVEEIVAETDLVDRLEEILVIDLLVVILAVAVVEIVVETVVFDQVAAALEAETTEVEATEVEATEVVTAEVAAGIEAVTEIIVVAEIIGAVVEDHLVGIDAGSVLTLVSC